MRRISLTIAIVIAACLAGANAIATQAKPVVPRAAIQAKALGDGPESPAEGRDALDSAVAAAVVGALSEQFNGREVSIKMDKVDVQPSSIRDRIVSGEGRLQIDGDEDWIGFRFRTLYDTSLGNASYPELTLGGISTTEREVPNDSLLVRQLDENVVNLLGKEFGHQAVRLQLDRITTVEAGKRYLRISASGIADFGREGTTPAQVEALYDRRDNKWLRVNYELGTTANWDSDSSVAEGSN